MRTVDSAVIGILIPPMFQLSDGITLRLLVMMFFSGSVSFSVRFQPVDATD